MAMKLSPAGACGNIILTTISDQPAISSEAKFLIAAQVEELLALVVEGKKRETSARRKISSLERRLADLNEKLILARSDKWGRKAEPFPDPDPDDEDPDDREDLLDDDEEEKPKGKRKRKMPKNMEIVIHDHFPDDMSCCTCGCQKKPINSWHSDRLEIVPERLICIRDVHHTVACNRSRCKQEESGKPVAAVAGRYIMADRSADLCLATEVAVQMLHEHLPAYRIEQRFRNQGVNLSRQAICSYIALLAGHFEPVAAAIMRYVMSGYVIHCDETPMWLQNGQKTMDGQKPSGKRGKKRYRQGFFWAVSRDERKWNPNSWPAVAFRFDLSRNGEVAEAMMEGSSARALTSDGYSVYMRFGSKDREGGPLILVRCWAHARREFYRANTAAPGKFAKWVLTQIKAIYKIERRTAGLPLAERLAIRQAEIVPLLSVLKAELEQKAPEAQGRLKSAIQYTLNAFEGLVQFTQDGRFEIDNNPIERCIRGITLSRKNSLSIGNEATGKVWAIFFTLIETCKLNKIDPRQYLHWLANEIERKRGVIEPEAMMPWHCPIGHGAL
ncbi:IS66 family transposase [Pseudogemmobacter sonorensis]|uniref:IS66 family transposase n=1 Tax=Pseudogemmobacter sonorensis TaxID=2989681 RepID=UPI0036CF4184